MRYVDTKNNAFTFAASSVAARGYNLNTLRTMVYSGTADGNPTIPGLNEYCQMYNYYRIIGVGWNCTFVNDTAFPMYIGQLATFASLPTGISPATATWTSLQKDLGAQSNSRRSMVGAAGGGHDIKTMKYYVNFGKVLGDQKEYNINTSYRSGAGVIVAGGTISQNCSDPANMCGGTLYCWAADGSAASVTGNVDTRVEMFFTIIFYNLQVEQN